MGTPGTTQQYYSEPDAKRGPYAATGMRSASPTDDADTGKAHNLVSGAH